MELRKEANTAACSPRTLGGRRQFFGVMAKGCLLMLDLIFSAGDASGSGPAATVSPAYATLISATPRCGTICRTPC